MGRGRALITVGCAVALSLGTGAVTANAGDRFEHSTQDVAVSPQISSAGAVGPDAWLQNGRDGRRQSYNRAEDTLTVGNVGALRVRWRVRLPSAVRGIAVGAGCVHVASGTRYVRLRAATGDREFATRVPDPNDPTRFITLESPILRTDGSVRVPFAASGYADIDDDAADVRYSLRSWHGDDAVVAGRTVAIQWSGYRESWVDLGKKIGVFSGPPRGRGPTVVGDHVLVASGNQLGAFQFGRCDPPAGKQSPTFCQAKWARSFAHATLMPVAVDDTTAAVVTEVGIVHVIDVTTGDDLWSVRLPGRATRPPAVAHGRIYAPAGRSVDAATYVIDARGCGSATCGYEWRLAMGQSIARQPVVAGGLVWVAGTARTVRAFPASRCGTPACPPIWNGFDDARITAGPVVSNGMLYLGTGQGDLVAFGLT